MIKRSLLCPALAIAMSAAIVSPVQAAGFGPTPVNNGIIAILIGLLLPASPGLR